MNNAMDRVDAKSSLGPDPDWIWQGDHCTHPSDRNHVSPSWERLTCEMYRVAANDVAIIKPKPIPAKVSVKGVSVWQLGDKIGVSKDVIVNCANSLKIPLASGLRGVKMVEEEKDIERISKLFLPVPNQHFHSLQLSLILGLREKTIIKRLGLLGTRPKFRRYVRESRMIRPFYHLTNALLEQLTSHPGST